MSDKKEIQVGDLVTINLNNYQTGSNTYVVAGKASSGLASVLNHPLAPECCLFVSDDILNNAFPSLQDSVEKCLHFSKKHREILGYTMAADLDALCYCFVIKKTLSPKQRQDLANMCGKVAAALLGSNVSSAIMEIKEHKYLLDEYNNSLLNSVRRVLDNPMDIRNKNERFTLFNLAGFILAQLANS